MATVISPKISEKISSKHRVTDEEVHQCFANRSGPYLSDSREDHAAEAPTYWFISETNGGRKLKVVFVHRDGNNYLRTAYPPNDTEIHIYDKYA